ncbi:MAG: AsmA-like C-terminal region-containing protein [Terracidiphilus sp.]
MTEERRGFWRRPWVWWTAGALAALLALAGGLLALAVRRAEPYLRARIVESLQERFHAHVELDSFRVSLKGGLEAEGRGLRIWPPVEVEGVTVPPGEGKPLIRLASFRFRAPLELWPGRPIHIKAVELAGLNVDLPPRAHFTHMAGSATPRRNTAAWVNFEVERVECTGAALVLETSKPGKQPMDYAIHRLVLTGLTAGGPMGFDAELEIPLPRGTAKVHGVFGPWRTSDPGESALAGDYRLEKADLGSFKGIAGTLDSTGHYKGTLRELVVDGETSTADFQLTHFGQALPLNTRFHAQVDGTNGDTWLDPVDAMLASSHVTAEGEIVRVPGLVVGGVQQQGGHEIALSVTVDRARIEDFLRLTSKTAKVLLTGGVTAKSSLEIPVGPLPVHERMKLNGDFALAQALFASEKIQGRIAELSLRGQGKPDQVKTTDPNTILSAIKGRFALAQGVLTLPKLDYSVPGARIDLKGTYELDGGALHFAGTAKLDAPISKIVGGWKSTLLKPLDGLLRKNGAGVEVPIHIEGTREDPKFGVDFDKMM